MPESIIPHSKPWITDDDIKVVNAALNEGMISTGNRVKEFESQCANYLRLPYTYATGSGTAALELALAALGISVGQEVVIPSYVCRAVADAVRTIGAIPVFCDIGDTWVMTPDNVSAVLTPRTTAIIVVHTFGIDADADGFRDFGIPIIEDCCQYFCPAVGTKGKLSVFSFHATKCLATGEGGLTATADPELAQRISTYLERTPLSARMSDLQAALGISQLARYPEMLERRYQLARQYLNHLPDEMTALLKICSDKTIFFRLPLQINAEFEELCKTAHAHGIHVRRGVDALLHRIFGLSDTEFFNTRDRFNETLSLPLYPALTDAQIDRVINLARSF